MTETLPADAPALDRFRAAVMADTEVQQMLSESFDPAEFSQRATDWAEAQGISLTDQDLIAIEGHDPLGIHMFGAAPQTGAVWPSRQWLPLRFAIEAGAIDWCHFAGAPLSEPFFADTAASVRTRPFNRLFRYRTSFDAFVDAPRSDTLPPDGFIFHMSRCGSTLVSQMLAASPANIMVSEAEPLDTMVQLPLLGFGIALEHHVAALQAMVAALGRKRSGSSKRYFVKLDSWHTLALPLFRQAFPDTPWIFLYRDPVEVLVSQMRMRGQQTAPGVLPPQLFGFAPGEEDLPDADYVARVLAKTCEAVIESWGTGGGMLVNYHELPDALFTRILPHFGVAPDEQERDLMAAAAERDAKAPYQPFTNDSEEKRREADAPVRVAAERHFSDIYTRLEAIRVSSPR